MHRHLRPSAGCHAKRPRAHASKGGWNDWFRVAFLLVKMPVGARDDALTPRRLLVRRRKSFGMPSDLAARSLLAAASNSQQSH